MNTLPTRARILHAAAHLFRRHGYHGTGLTEILILANAPKGSLYHHFPDGKSGLALAAAKMVSEDIITIIDDTFLKAANYTIGATSFCHKLADLFDTNENWKTCPIPTMLFDGSDNTRFSDAIDRNLSGWMTRTAFHASRLGMNTQRATIQSELLIVTLQGAWTIARARGSSDPIRRIPEFLFG